MICVLSWEHRSRRRWVGNFRLDISDLKPKNDGGAKCENQEFEFEWRRIASCLLIICVLTFGLVIWNWVLIGHKDFAVWVVHGLEAEDGVNVADDSAGIFFGEFVVGIFELLNRGAGADTGIAILLQLKN